MAINCCCGGSTTCDINLRQCPSIDWIQVGGSGIGGGGDNLILQTPQTTGWVNDADGQASVNGANAWEFNFDTANFVGNEPLMIGVDANPGAMANWPDLDVGFYLLYRPGVYHRYYSKLAGGLTFHGDFGAAAGAGDNQMFTIRYDGAGTLEWLVNGTSVRTQGGYSPPATVQPAAISYYSGFWSGAGEIVNSEICGISLVSGEICDVLQALADAIGGS